MSRNRYVSVNDFTGEVTKIFKTYLEEVTEGTEKAVVDTALDAEDKLHTAGKFENRTGRYRKGWMVTFNKLRYGMEAVVHNKRYPLTHLLESGHSKWLWGRDTGEDVKAFPHIADVNEAAQKMLEEEIRKLA